MSARIFIWVGHPRQASLSHGLADAYARGAESAGADVRRMNVADMAFESDSFDGYTGDRVGLEPDLVAWQEAITWSEHMCWIYPYWWGGMPARMKAAIDKALVPGFGFKYRDKGALWDKLLKGRTGDGIITSDTPPWYDTLLYHKPGRRVLRNQVYGFVGIKPGKVVQIGSVKSASETKVKGWLDMAYKMGAEAGRR